MEVKEFFSLLDAVRYDDSVDEMNPELRGMVQKYYPIIRKLYNMLIECGMLEESKQNTMKLTESDVNYIVMEATKRILERHGVKPQKAYKDDFGKMKNPKTNKNKFKYNGEDIDESVNEAHGIKKGVKDDFGKMKNPKMNKPVSKKVNFNYDDMDESVNEAHGVKKHNMPKDKNSAMRKGNREAERDIYGDGFKSKDKIHNPKSYKRNNKINVNDIDDSMDD